MHIFDQKTELSQAVGQQILTLANTAIAERGKFTVAISGGSLPKLIAPLLQTQASTTDWSAWHLLLADERIVPLDHPDSNYKLTQTELGQHVPIPAENIYPISPLLAPDDVAHDYQATVERVVDVVDGLPQFDLILLGMGPDGHTASLFPDHVLLDEQDRWVAPIIDSPKPPPERVTLTLPVINHARHVIFVCTGAGKAEALHSVINQPGQLPASHIQPTSGSLAWYVDQGAASELSSS